MVLTAAEIALGRRNFMKALAGVPPRLASGAAAALRGPKAGGPIEAGFIGPGRPAGQTLNCGVDMAFKTTVACLAANQAMDTRVDVPRLA